VILAKGHPPFTDGKTGGILEQKVEPRSHIAFTQIELSIVCQPAKQYQKGHQQGTLRQPRRNGYGFARGPVQCLELLCHIAYPPVMPSLLLYCSGRGYTRPPSL